MSRRSPREGGFVRPKSLERRLLCTGPVGWGCRQHRRPVPLKPKCRKLWVVPEHVRSQGPRARPRETLRRKDASRACSGRLSPNGTYSVCRAGRKRRNELRSTRRALQRSGSRRRETNHFDVAFGCHYNQGIVSRTEPWSIYARKRITVNEQDNKSRSLVVFTAALLLAPLVVLHAAEPAQAGSPTAYNPKTAEELRVRDGLPNFFAKLAAGRPVRIAYLGGSITAANGWRPKSFAWFKSQYPNAEVIEINAAISGTGSDYGACRIAADVLSKNPDLVFMEHRVNGGGGYEAKSVEGIIRQIWKENPHTDICLVYTLSQGMLKDLQAGKQTSFGAIMETVANAYGIPSIDLGVEIAKREKAGDLIFKGNAPVEGKLVFSKDGTHPGNEGHEVYQGRDCPLHARHEEHGQTAGPSASATAGSSLLGVGGASPDHPCRAELRLESRGYENGCRLPRRFWPHGCDAARRDEMRQGRRDHHGEMERHDHRLQRHPSRQRHGSRGDH